MNIEKLTRANSLKAQIEKLTQIVADKEKVLEKIKLGEYYGFSCSINYRRFSGGDSSVNIEISKSVAFDMARADLTKLKQRLSDLKREFKHL